jgi:DNA-binding Lrp family transcriptional regulator
VCEILAVSGEHDITAALLCKESQLRVRYPKDRVIRALRTRRRGGLLDDALLDLLDRQIVGALLAHPRASIAQVAAVTFTSEATASRRVNALLADGTVSVVATLDGEATRRSRSVFVRLRCRPGGAYRTAERLGRWPECGSVKVLTGSVDCIAEIQYTSQEHLQAITRDRLPALDEVLAVFSNQVIRRFSTPHSWHPGLLAPDLVDSLRVQRLDWWDDRLPDRPVVTSGLDQAIAAQLGVDGRSTWRRLGEVCGASAITARRRAEAMMQTGALRLRTVVEPEAVDLPVDAFIALNVNPTHLSRAGELLAQHPAVLMIAATTGDRNLCGEVALGSDAELYTFISETVGGLPGLQLADVAVALQTVKRAGRPVVLRPGQTPSSRISAVSPAGS